MPLQPVQQLAQHVLQRLDFAARFVAFGRGARKVGTQRGDLFGKRELLRRGGCVDTLPGGKCGVDVFIRRAFLLALADERKNRHVRFGEAAPVAGFGRGGWGQVARELRRIVLHCGGGDTEPAGYVGCGVHALSLALLPTPPLVSATYSQGCAILGTKCHVFNLAPGWHWVQHLWRG